MATTNVDPKRPHSMLIEVLEERSPSGKTMFKCGICGRVSQTPDKWCYTIEMHMRGEKNPVEEKRKD
jgi:hypothetical protein